MAVGESVTVKDAGSFPEGVRELVAGMTGGKTSTTTFKTKLKEKHRKFKDAFEYYLARLNEKIKKYNKEHDLGLEFLKDFGVWGRFYSKMASNNFVYPRYDFEGYIWTFGIRGYVTYKNFLAFGFGGCGGMLIKTHPANRNFEKRENMALGYGGPAGAFFWQNETFRFDISVLVGAGHYRIFNIDTSQSNIENRTFPVVEPGIGFAYRFNEYIDCGIQFSYFYGHIQDMKELPISGFNVGLFAGFSLTFDKYL
jgi:hypothetical protein